MKKIVMLLCLVSAVLCANTPADVDHSSLALLVTAAAVGVQGYINYKLDANIRGAGYAPKYVFDKEQGKWVSYGESDWHGQRIAHRIATATGLTFIYACAGGLIAGGEEGVGVGLSLGFLSSIIYGALEIIGSGMETFDNVNWRSWKYTDFKGEAFFMPGLASIASACGLAYLISSDQL